jgi:hypothetical protein
VSSFTSIVSVAYYNYYLIFFANISIFQIATAPKFIAEMILITAAAHGCIRECDRLLATFLQQKTIPEDFLSRLARTFRPISSCGGQNWSTRNEPHDFPYPDVTTPPTVMPAAGTASVSSFSNVTTPPPAAGKASMTEDAKLGTQDAKLGKLLELLVETRQNPRFSPNVLSLFVEKSVFPIESLTSPAVNHRSLHLKRIWFEHAVSDRNHPNIISTLLGMGESSNYHDRSLSRLDYLILPYKLNENHFHTASEHSPAHAVSSEFVFAHNKEIATDHSATHVGVQDVLDLIRLLSPVCISLTQ